MSPQAKAILQRASINACESMPGADDVAVATKTAALLASYAAQLEAKLFYDENGLLTRTSN